MDLREVPETGRSSRHPWEVARARFFSALLREACPSPVRVLDVGAGDGYLARSAIASLPEGSEVHCYEPSYTDAQLSDLGAGERARVRFTRRLPDAPFDVVLALDVVEHVPDDREFLGDLVRRALRRNGRALVSVPAWMSLFTRHDIELGHHRRYRPAQLRALLEHCELSVERSGGLFHSLLVPRALAKLAERARGVRSRPEPGALGAHADTGLSRWRAGPYVGGAVCAALAVDTWVSWATERLRVP
ncbi:MAG TPA: class I SAM-dependent methyltransferase, partial [Myxococcota bacterium]|nr:class I SAM-dependent methyltransferase [Myxococcota bacterium]